MWDVIVGFACGGICVAVAGIIIIWRWLIKAFERF